MNLEQMHHYRREKGYSYAKLAELSGVPLSTVQKIFGGITKNPRFETLQALEEVLKPEPKKYTIYTSDGQSSYVCESRAYKTAEEEDAEWRQEMLTERKLGPYTLENYYALPPDQRVELIDGYFFKMEAPSVVHQIVVFALGNFLRNFISEKGGSCIPFVAPTDVQLDGDEYTMIEPDVFVVCDRNKLTKKCIVGAPDLMIEVLSPSTRNKDLRTKLMKYMVAGVREYWLVDADRRSILVYRLEDLGAFPTIYGFCDKVPVGIFGDELTIDFLEIEKQLEGL